MNTNASALSMLRKKRRELGRDLTQDELDNLSADYDVERARSVAAGGLSDKESMLFGALAGAAAGTGIVSGISHPLGVKENQSTLGSIASRVGTPLAYGVAGLGAVGAAALLYSALKRRSRRSAVR